MTPPGNGAASAVGGTGPLQVVSPHLDDGVLSAGAVLASRRGATVTTVFAADTPPPFDEALTDWDRAGGMQPGRNPIAVRRAEDRAALERLGATPRWLGFVDTQYRPPPSVEAVAAVLAAATEPAVDVLAPLGIWHSDHVLVADACLLVFDERRASGPPRARWWLYADVPYRSLDAGAHLARRLAALAARGLHVEEVPPPLDPGGRHTACKQAALACYATQLRALASDGRLGVEDAARPERLWALEAEGR